MNFKEKNDFLVKHTAGEHFLKDLELFKIHCPNSRLHIDLKRVNSFNKKKLDGLMLYELLGKVSPEEILKNRAIETSKDDVSILNSVEEVKTLFEDTNIDMDDFPNETLSIFVGLKKEDVSPFVEFMESIYAMAPKQVETIEEVQTIVEESEISIDGISEEFTLLLVGKTKDEILKILTFIEAYSSGFTQKKSESTDGVSSEEISEEDKSQEELSDEVSNLENKEELLEEKNQELEDKEQELSEKEEELSDKESELEDKEEQLDEKAQELEDKESELSKKEAELKESTSKKKGTKGKSSRK